MKAVYTILGQIVKYIPPRFNLHSSAGCSSARISPANAPVANLS